MTDTPTVCAITIEVMATTADEAMRTAAAYRAVLLDGDSPAPSTVTDDGYGVWTCTTKFIARPLANEEIAKEPR